MVNPCKCIAVLAMGVSQLASANVLQAGDPSCSLGTFDTP